MTQPSRAARYLPLIIFALALVSLACFVYPMYVIRPFRHQGETELGIALFVKQIGPWLSAACAALGLAVLVYAWPRTRWVARSSAVLALLLAIGGVYLARLNVYELMFHPAGAPQFQSVDRAHLDKDDMLLTVRVNGVSRAYPIREMGYHHIINDVVGGEPIVSTY